MKRFKNILLGALFVCMVALSYVSASLIIGGDQGPTYLWLSALFMQSGPEYPQLPEERENIISAAAHPAKTGVISAEADGLYVPESVDQYSQLLSHIESFSHGAFGSMQQLHEIDFKRYCALFQGPALYLSYDAEIPLFLLSVWNGSSQHQDVSSPVKTLLFTVQGERVLLAFSGSEGCYYAETAADAQALFDIAEDVGRQHGEPNAAFAFQSDAYRSLAGDEPVYLSSFKLKTYALLTPSYLDSQKSPRAILEAFGFNQALYTVTNYKNGSRVYSEGGTVLQMDAQGVLTYNAPAGQGIKIEPYGSGQGAFLAGALEEARVLLRRIWEEAGAIGTLSLSAIEADEAMRLYFDVLIDGAPFDRERSSAALQVENIAGNWFITRVVLSPLRLEDRGEEHMRTLIPIPQAAAAIPDGADARLCVRYVEEDGVLIPKLLY